MIFQYFIFEMRFSSFDGRLLFVHYEHPLDQFIGRQKSIIINWNADFNYSERIRLNSYLKLCMSPHYYYYHYQRERKIVKKIEQ